MYVCKKCGSTNILVHYSKYMGVCVVDEYVCIDCETSGEHIEDIAIKKEDHYESI